MKRIVLLQSDEKFEPYLEVALRTFLTHNSGWMFMLLDLGLTPEQREKYAGFCHIIKVKHDDRWHRFIHAQARIDALSALCTQGWLVLQLDADTLTLGNIDEWTREFEESEAGFSGVSEWPHALMLQFKTGKPFVSLLRDLPALGNRGTSDHSYNFGVCMLKGEEGSNLMLQTSVLMRDHADALMWAEQSGMNAALYGGNYEVLRVNRANNFMLNIWQLKVTRDWTAECLDDGSDIKIVHYAGHAIKIRPEPPWCPHEVLWKHHAELAPTLLALAPKTTPVLV
jgi:hypothetical protein